MEQNKYLYYYYYTLWYTQIKKKKSSFYISLNCCTSNLMATIIHETYTEVTMKSVYFSLIILAICF